MAYCRFEEGISDAYVWESTDSWTIRSCLEVRPGITEDREFIFRREALRYLRDQRASGVMIPDRALSRIEEEIEFLGDELQEPYSWRDGAISMRRLADRIVCEDCRLINPREYFMTLKPDESNLDDFLGKRDKVVPAVFTSRTDAINHINDHMAAGHLVEADAIARLNDEIKLLGDGVVAGITPLKAKYFR